MKLNINYQKEVAELPAKVNGDCNHAGANSYYNIEHNADTFSDGNYYPDYIEEKVLMCRNCGMYWNTTLQCWDVL